MHTWLVTLGIVASSVSWGAGFDCEKAQLSTEKAICANNQLSHMDSLLSENFAEVYRDTSNLRGLVAGQKAWLQGRNSCTDDVDCLTRHYRERLQLLWDMEYKIHKDEALLDQPHMDLHSSGNFKLVPHGEWRQHRLVEQGTLEALVGSSSASVQVIAVTSYNDVMHAFFLVSSWKAGDAEGLVLDIVEGEAPKIIDSVIFYATPEDPRPSLELVSSSFDEKTGLLQFSVANAQHSLALREYSLATGNMLSRENISSKDEVVLRLKEREATLPTLPNVHCDVERCVLSPDGQHIAVKQWTGRENLALFDAKTKQEGDRIINGFQWKNEDWHFIGKLAWEDTSKALYFNNVAAKACIWRVDFEAKTIIKIVPEHEAVNAHFVRVRGKPYVLFEIELKNEFWLATP